MRGNREVARQDHEKAVETASRKFREHGYDGIDIVGLMKAVAMTHEGFYEQFSGKEALAVEATECALRDNLAKWVSIMESSTDDPLGALVDWYLSGPHLETRAEGCPFAALAAEAPRHGHDLKAAFGNALERSIEALAAASPGAEDPYQARCEAIRAIATMIGGLILARAVPGNALSREILRCARPNGQDRSGRNHSGTDRS